MGPSRGDQRGLGPERVRQVKIKGREEGEAGEDGPAQKRERRGRRLGSGSERGPGDPSAERRPVSLTAGNGAPARSIPAHRTRRGPPESCRAASRSGPLRPRCPLTRPAHLLTCLLLPAVLCHPASSLTLSKINEGPVCSEPPPRTPQARGCREWRRDPCVVASPLGWRS